MVKLNLGCGEDKREGYTNVDIRKEVNPDLVHDLEKPLPFPDNSVEEIIAFDIVEHFSFHKVEEILRDWFRVLKPGGVIHIRCPDMEAIAEKVILSGKFGWKEISWYVYGGQDYEFNYHKAGFTKRTLKELLESIGFVVEEIREDGFTNMYCRARKP